MIASIGFGEAAQFQCWMGPLWFAIVTSVVTVAVNILKVGSTRSGKSYSAISDVLKISDKRNTAVVVCDPHGGSLARPLVGHLIARGHRHRIRFDKFSNFEYMLDWRFIRKSTAESFAEREAENEETLRFFSNIMVRQQGGGSLGTSPMKEEWVMKALALYINQRVLPGEDKLYYAFEPTSEWFRKLVRGCDRSTVAGNEAIQPFLEIADGKIPASKYEPAKRLIQSVCKSPAFKYRCSGTGAFNLESFLDRKGILLVEGENKGKVSPEAMRAMFGAIVNLVIRYVRTRPKPFPRVALILDEATNARLITTTEKEAAAECQKYGLDLTIMVQLLDFPTTDIRDGILANCVWHQWFYNASPYVIRKASDDLGANLDKDKIESLRTLKVGERWNKFRDRVWQDRSPELPDPFGLPGLTEKKIDQALHEMYQLPEYRNLTELCLSNSTATENETTQSSNEPPRTSASPDILQNSSPADRLNTEDLFDSETDEDDDCESSEP